MELVVYPEQNERHEQDSLQTKDKKIINIITSTKRKVNGKFFAFAFIVLLSSINFTGFIISLFNICHEDKYIISISLWLTISSICCILFQVSTFIWLLMGYKYPEQEYSSPFLICSMNWTMKTKYIDKIKEEGLQIIFESVRTNYLDNYEYTINQIKNDKHIDQNILEQLTNITDISITDFNDRYRQTSLYKIRKCGLHLLSCLALKDDDLLPKRNLYVISYLLLTKIIYITIIIIGAIEMQCQKTCFVNRGLAITSYSTITIALISLFI